MKRPSPELLDLLYRAGAYPIDDLNVQDAVKHTSEVIASTWLVPTTTIPAILFIMGGGSGDLSALIFELRRLAEITALTAVALNWKPESRSLARPLCYHYFVQVTHLDARIYSKSIEPWDEALTPLLHTAPLHTWFQPTADYAQVYAAGYLRVDNLPLCAEPEDDFLGDPDEPVARRVTLRDTDEDLTDDELALFTDGDGL